MKTLEMGLLVVLIAGAVSSAPVRASDEQKKASTVAFFENLSAHCGKAYEGETAFPPDPDHPLAGARLLMRLESCTETELRIPFQVGEDRSRTWILTLDGEDLVFKHDHRHADGTPDAQTDYGGRAATGGTPFRQSFPADAHTRELIPEASTNVWTLEITREQKRFIYYLERHGQPRYRAVFNLEKPVEVP